MSRYLRCPRTIFNDSPAEQIDCREVVSELDIALLKECKITLKSHYYKHGTPNGVRVSDLGGT